MDWQEPQSDGTPLAARSHLFGKPARVSLAEHYWRASAPALFTAVGRYRLCPCPPLGERTCSPIGGVERDRGAVDARDAGAEFCVRRLLGFAEEHIAVVDLAFNLEDRQRAKPAFAAAAIEDHVDARDLQRFEQGLVGADGDRLAETRNLR